MKNKRIKREKKQELEEAAQFGSTDTVLIAIHELLVH